MQVGGSAHPPPRRPLGCHKLRKLRHLLHGDGVDEPGIGALGGKETKREKMQARASPTQLWEPRQPRHPRQQQCPCGSPSQARERARVLGGGRFGLGPVVTAEGDVSP